MSVNCRKFSSEYLAVIFQAHIPSTGSKVPPTAHPSELPIVVRYQLVEAYTAQLLAVVNGTAHGNKVEVSVKRDVTRAPTEVASERLRRFPMVLLLLFLLIVTTARAAATAARAPPAATHSHLLGLLLRLLALLLLLDVVLELMTGIRASQRAEETVVAHLVPGVAAGRCSTHGT